MALLECAQGKGALDSFGETDPEFSELEEFNQMQIRGECCKENALACEGFSICDIEPLPELPEVDPELPELGPEFECHMALLECAQGKGALDSFGETDPEFWELEEFNQMQIRGECCEENALVCEGFSICDIEPLPVDPEPQPDCIYGEGPNCPWPEPEPEIVDPEGLKELENLPDIPEGVDVDYVINGLKDLEKLKHLGEMGEVEGENGIGLDGEPLEPINEV